MPHCLIMFRLEQPTCIERAVVYRLSRALCKKSCRYRSTELLRLREDRDRRRVGDWKLRASAVVDNGERHVHKKYKGTTR